MSLAIDQTLLQAVEAHNSGKLQDAERLYRAILQVQPQHPDANHNLGVLAVEAGKPETALKHLKAAIKSNHTDARFWISYITLLIDIKRLPEATAALKKFKRLHLAGGAAAQLAEKLAVSLHMPRSQHGKLQPLIPSQEQVRELLSQYTAGHFSAAEHLARAQTENFPHHPYAWHILGAILGQTGRLEDSLAPLRQAVRLEPNDAGAHANLGISLQGLGHLTEAEASYREAIRLRPDLFHVHSNLGNALQGLGRLPEAEESYREAIRLKPDYAEAHSNLGITLRLLGRLGDAEASCREAIRLNPGIPLAYSNLGLALQGLGRLTEAEASYREAIRLKPDHSPLHTVLGGALQGLGRLSEAEASYREAIRLKPDHAEAYSDLGTTLLLLGRPAEAEANCREATRLNPDLPIAQSNLGLALQSLGRLTEAEESYRQAIRLKPDFNEAHLNLGNVLQILGRPPEAAATYREAIRLKPDFPEAHNNLGIALQALGRPTEAETTYREALRLKPDYAEAHTNRGMALQSLGRLPEAEAAYREAIRLKPGYAEAYSNLGMALQAMGRLKEAEATYREGILLKPGYAEGHNNLGIALQTLGRPTEAEASFREAIRLKPELTVAHSNLLFGLNYFEALSPEAVLLEAKRYGSAVSARAEPKFASWSVSREPSKLRVGFVSGDLRNHPVGYFVEGLFKHLDHRQLDLYVFPTAPKSDDLTIRIRPLVHEWIPIFGKGDFEAANLIHQQGIHVLVDLSGHTADNRLPVFSYKPAPVQASWLGYFATTGLPEMDYFLGDPYTVPKSERPHFSEKIWNLPQTWLCLTPTNQHIQVSPLPALKNGYLTFGNCSRVSKIGDEVIKLWAMILQRAPHSKLFLKSMDFEDGEFAREMRARFASHGTPDHCLILEGPSQRAQYLEAYSRVDMVLDTFPYPGGTTSFDSLWMGVPVLTLRGNRFLSHIGESIVRNAALANWIADDHNDYVNKAVTFGSDHQSLAETRKHLRDQVLQSPLFDAELFANNFLSALWGMFKQFSPGA